MGWAVGYDPNWERDIGYGVPALCDAPGCGAHIDRGLSFVCGGEPRGGELGCGLYFCAAHQYFLPRSEFTYGCVRCAAGQDPYPATPDVRVWVTHKLRDPSWERWRAENVELVTTLEAALVQALAGDYAPVPV